MILAKANTDCQLPYPSAVIFDFDGVIVDSLNAHLNAWNQACLQVFRHPVKNLNSLSGLSTKAIASKITHTYGHPSLSRQLTALKETLLNSYVTEVPLIPGIQGFLSKLNDLKIKIAIGSNSRRDFIVSLLRHHNIEISTIVSREDVKKAKPHPECFLTCAHKMLISEIERPNVLVIEDSTHGIKAAIKAQMIPCGITTQHNAAVLRSAGAAHTFDLFSEINFLPA